MFAIIKEPKATESKGVPPKSFDCKSISCVAVDVLLSDMSDNTVPPKILVHTAASFKRVLNSSMAVI